MNQPNETQLVYGADRKGYTVHEQYRDRPDSEIELPVLLDKALEEVE